MGLGIIEITYKNLPAGCYCPHSCTRLYQDALWIVESEPALAWLMLVSSIEAAANYWCTVKASPLERLKESKPKLVTYLDNLCIEGLSAEVAESVADSLGSTKKFVDFVMAFLPPAPSLRPADWGRHPWESKQMKKTMNIIYGYRSNALHGAVPSLHLCANLHIFSLIGKPLLKNLRLLGRP